MQYSQDVLRDWIDRCLNEGRNLSNWEENEFLPNVDDQIDRSGYLSPRQIEILERIYTEKVP